MNKEANDLRLWLSNEIIKYFVDHGYTFFSSVYLHSDFNEISVKHSRLRKDIPLEVWSDSLFFHVQDRAALLRISLSYKDYTSYISHLNTRERVELNFHLLAEARPLEQLNELALSDKLEFNAIPFDSVKWSNFGQPKIPRFVELDVPESFSILEYGDYFSEYPDRWIRSIRGSTATHPYTNNAEIKSLVRWLDPMWKYVAPGRILIPDHCGFTRDSNFVQSEALMRDRVNSRVLREVAEFGKFL